MARLRTHPGEILAEDYPTPLDLSARQVAAEIGVPANRVSEIIRGRRGITTDTAIRLGVRLGTAPQFWLNLQNAHDLSTARATVDYCGIRPRAAEPAATT